MTVGKLHGWWKLCIQLGSVNIRIHSTSIYLLVWGISSTSHTSLKSKLAEWLSPGERTISEIPLSRAYRIYCSFSWGKPFRKFRFQGGVTRSPNQVPTYQLCIRVIRVCLKTWIMYRNSPLMDKSLPWIMEHTLVLL